MSGSIRPEHYPDAQEAIYRIANASAALDVLLEFGGAAYIATREITEELKCGELYLVKGAKPIKRSVYAVYPVRSTRTDLVTDVIGEFKYRVSVPRKPRRK